MKDLKKLTFRAKEFWVLVDSITDTKYDSIVKSIGGRALLRKKYLAKCNNATKRHSMGISLSERDYACLVYHAGIHLDEIGRGGYELARLGDRGSYRRRFCRFITHEENLQERAPLEQTERMRLNSLRNVKFAQMSLTREVRSRAGRSSASVFWERKHREIRDEELLLARRRISKRRVKYPDWGWKTRLAKELGVGIRKLAGFLRRNPLYLENLAP